MNRYNVDALRCNLEATKIQFRLNLDDIHQKIKSCFNRSKVRSTDQRLDQHIDRSIL